jgi:predicted DsbA family dithiol-disulfide isomerase
VTAEQARREFDADVTWLPFDLHPEYPPEGIPLADLHRRYGIGSGEDDPLRDRFAAYGLEYNRPEVVPNTKLALRLGELARELGVQWSACSPTLLRTSTSSKARRARRTRSASMPCRRSCSTGS